MVKKDLGTTKTAEREKIALWLDRPDLDALREIQKGIGVPVSEQIRRAVSSYLEEKGSKKGKTS